MTSAQSGRRASSKRRVDTLWLLTMVPVRWVAARMGVLFPTRRQATARSSSVRRATGFPLACWGVRRRLHSDRRALGSILARASWLLGAPAEAIAVRWRSRATGMSLAASAQRRAAWSCDEKPPPSEPTLPGCSGRPVPAARSISPFAACSAAGTDPTVRMCAAAVAAQPVRNFPGLGEGGWAISRTNSAPGFCGAQSPPATPPGPLCGTRATDSHHHLTVNQESRQEVSIHPIGP